MTLLDRLRKILSTSDNKKTELFNAVVKGTHEEVGRLIDKGANVNARDSTSGHTPLMIAAMLNHQNVVKILIDKGANINKKDHYGNTVGDLAINSRGEIRKLLNKNAKPESSEFFTPNFMTKALSGSFLTGQSPNIPN
jgi:ankyrin repeat protein